MHVLMLRLFQPSLNWMPAPAVNSIAFALEMRYSITCVFTIQITEMIFWRFHKIPQLYTLCFRLILFWSSTVGCFDGEWKSKIWGESWSDDLKKCAVLCIVNVWTVMNEQWFGAVCDHCSNMSFYQATLILGKIFVQKWIRTPGQVVGAKATL